MIISDGCVTVETNQDLKQLQTEYALESSSVDDIANDLWFSFGIVMIDNRPDAVYSQCAAQNSPEFYDEEMTEQDLEERRALRSCYD